MTYAQSKFAHQEAALSFALPSFLDDVQPVISIPLQRGVIGAQAMTAHDPDGFAGVRRRLPRSS